MSKACLFWIAAKKAVQNGEVRIVDITVGTGQLIFALENEQFNKRGVYYLYITPLFNSKIRVTIINTTGSCFFQKSVKMNVVESTLSQAIREGVVEK